ncbi:MAG: helix-turn-helix domain-containing protein [Hyalangium sp.]|uniref:helix-turn-helix domain-containing protein n=1 Tax=Hyalangium sp. TaxID=2028555 RepID=UPI00389AA620
MPRPADPNARASLISAARAEFVKKGLRGARIEDITAACGLSKGAFYLHFSSKEALFGEVVGTVKERLDVLGQERLEQMERFYAEHGHLNAKELASRSERYERLVQLETELDLRALELMWDYRDVMHVLLRGSQGTDFESLFSVMVDAEVERVATDFRRLSGSKASRADVSPTLFGTVIVGAYSLLVQQMSRMREKPDLASWASDLQRIFREGVMGRDSEPAPVRLPRAVSSRTSPRQGSARAPTRRTPRKP